MSIWLIQACNITGWSCPCRRYVPEEVDEIFKEEQNASGIAGDILLVGYDDDGKTMTEQYVE